MTLVLSILSNEYTLMLADTKRTVLGPGEMSFGDTLISIPKGEFRVLDGYPWVQKVFFTDNLNEAIAYSGERESSDPVFPGFTKSVGYQLDEELFDEFRRKANLQQFPTLTEVNYPGQQVIHVYEIQKKTIVAKLSYTPMFLTWHYYNSKINKLTWVGIGSGEDHLSSFLSKSPFSEQWEELRGQICLEKIDEIIQFFCGLFYEISLIQNDVNCKVSSWFKPKNESQWVNYGYHVMNQAMVWIHNKNEVASSSPLL